MSESDAQEIITNFALPWYTPEGELQYSSMTMSAPGGVDKRKAKSIIRKWYKEEIGVNIDKIALEALWKCRFETKAFSEKALMEYMHDMARRSYEEIVEESDSGVQETTGEEAGK